MTSAVLRASTARGDRSYDVALEFLEAGQDVLPTIEAFVRDRFEKHRLAG